MKLYADLFYFPMLMEEEIKTIPSPDKDCFDPVYCKGLDCSQCEEGYV